METNRFNGSCLFNVYAMIAVYSTVGYINYRQNCPKGSSGSSAGIVFTHGPIFRFFAPQGRHAARSSLPIFSLIGSGVSGVGLRPQKLEFYQYNYP